MVYQGNTQIEFRRWLKALSTKVVTVYSSPWRV